MNNVNIQYVLCIINGSTEFCVYKDGLDFECVSVADFLHIPLYKAETDSCFNARHLLSTATYTLSNTRGLMIVWTDNPFLVCFDFLSLFCSCFLPASFVLCCIGVE